MTKTKLSELLSKHVVLADGAMGTMLYQSGVFVNASFDELNLSNPKLVSKIHKQYVEAGVDFIETNTFGANEVKLSRFGLGEQVEKINKAGVEIARQAACGEQSRTTGDKVLVAASMGPLARDIALYNQITQQQAAAAFQRQASALAEAGADFIILETFSNTDELLLAIEAVRSVSALEIVAQMTANEQNETPYGEKIDHAIARIAAQPAVTVVGLNCSVGPSAMLTALELIRAVTDKPVSVQPNAGMPRQVESRLLYMSTPEYMAEFAKRFYEKGARIIGGCCGTTPAHIREIVLAVRAIDKAATSKTRLTTVTLETPPKIEIKETPLAQKSKFGDKLSKGQTVTTIEITPPKGLSIDPILEKAKLCAEMGIDAVNIPDGPRASSRLSPMVTAIKIQQAADLEAILHFCCRDRNLIGMQSDILGANAIGLRNLLVITGDPPKMGDYPQATGVFDMDSIALTGVIRNLNRGLDLGGSTFNPPTSLVIGVGANPVASDIKREIEKFQQKVLAGAEFAITQPVFEADTLFRFLDSIESFKIPIIAGIWPFTSLKNAEFMANEVPGVVVPSYLLDRMAKAKTQQDGRIIGVEIAKELIAQIQPRVAGFAVSAPFGNVKIALAALAKLEVNQI
ncbi:MAG: bifunctional homocysteine S-methyltransferase/methylenetetrahydrofolate reductase [Sedimentisphaerales bacterium]|nr:bifunctional homocysteine S-methyltransferase/methylenetetrahydrofolate reductase [Sedimentisphaerales bacterium]